ncbi:hypothetical protein B0H11DRAFT_2283806 [Mycena galericulata]|nr:hypothetical protein B0H11DRAFT_2283806 [Mycena galericulata]
MGNTPSIFETTPQEHAAMTARFLEKQREIVIWPPETSVPSGHVRVQFYAYRYKVRDGLRPDMESVLPLEKSGELSLFAVRRLWGLETCSIIDPLELKLGFPVDPNLLPSEVVKELVDKHGCIKVIEPYASYETLAKRQLRHIALACASIAHSWYILARYDAHKDYETLRRFTNRLSEPYNVSETRYIDWMRAAYLTIFLALIFFVVGSVKGVDLGIVRAFDVVTEIFAASVWLRFGFWSALTVIFFAAPGGHAKAAGLEENTKIMLVLSA